MPSVVLYKSLFLTELLTVEANSDAPSDNAGRTLDPYFKLPKIKPVGESISPTN